MRGIKSGQQEQKRNGGGLDKGEDSKDGELQ